MLITGARGKDRERAAARAARRARRAAAVGPARRRTTWCAPETFVAADLKDSTRCARGRRRRRRRASRRGAGRGAVRGDRRPEPARHLPRLRGLPARGRERVVFASSNHATGMYPVGEPLDGDAAAAARTGSTAPRRSTARRSGACTSTASGSSVVCLRIGSFRQRPRERRELSTWLSHADGVRLVRAALTAATSTSRSSTARRPTRAAGGRPDTLIGFVPQDDAEVVRGRARRRGLRLQGGPNAAPDHGGWAT